MIQNPKSLFDVVTYTGNGGNQEIGPNAQKGYSGITSDRGDIGHSLRFRSSASAYLSKTYTGTMPVTWTFAAWVKRGTLGSTQGIISARNASATNIVLQCDFNSSDNIQVVGTNSAGTLILNLITNAKFRDPSSWLFVVISVDTSPATPGANDCYIEVNGIRQTLSTASYPAQNSTFGAFGNTSPMYIGRRLLTTSGSDAQFDGYFARLCGIVNSKLTSNSFGYINTELNEWVSKTQAECKTVVEAGGTNSFMLDFDDNTSQTTMGYDKSNKANHWALSWDPLVAGTNYDWMTDVPGNSYCNISPLIPGGSPISNANLTFSGTYGVAKPTMLLPSTGKWYAEIVYSSIASSPTTIGIVKSTGGDYAYYRNDGQKDLYLGGGVSGYGNSWTVGNVIGMAADIDAGTITFYKDGVSQGNISYKVADAWFQCSGATASVNTGSWNFGQYPFQSSSTYSEASGGWFRYQPPAGYKALCQVNLPAKDLTEFPVDLAIIKNRDAAVDFTWQDSLRGFGKHLTTSSPNGTNAESTDTNSMIRSPRGGLYLGNSSLVNTSGQKYVAYLFKGAAPEAVNTDGDIHTKNGGVSTYVKVNKRAGYSIVTYTGCGSNATVGHGLGVAPKMVMYKKRNGAYDGCVYHKSIGAAQRLILFAVDGTIAQATDSTFFQSTDPSSSVLYLGTREHLNANTATYVAYCFAEIPGYSKFGSYTGNGDANGPFVYCGFKPKYVMVKCSGTTGHWFVFDSARDTYNVAIKELYPNLSNAEAAGTTDIDFLSNGFKLRAASTGINGASSFIFAAFAEFPQSDIFSTTLAR